MFETLCYIDLFSPTHRRATALAAIPWFLQDIATYGIGIFTPTIISALAFSEKSSFFTREMAAAKGASVVNSFLIIGFI